MELCIVIERNLCNSHVSPSIVGLKAKHPLLQLDVHVQLARAASEKLHRKRIAPFKDTPDTEQEQLPKEAPR